MEHSYGKSPFEESGLFPSILHVHWTEQTTDWFAGNPRRKEEIGPYVRGVLLLFKQYASKQECLFLFFDLSASNCDGL